MSRRRVLFVDDDSLIVEFMAEVLAEMGCAVTTAESGQEAVDIFAQDPGAFDLVLTDLMMLEMTGDKLSERLHVVRPDIPVVVMTGTPEGLSRERIRSAGIRKVLAKPLTRAELREALKEVL